MELFPNLFKPIKLGSLTIKNRIGGSCTTTGGADINGYITEECLYSYAARSEGGAGFITIECTFATDWGAKTTSFGNPRISGRAYYEGMSNLAEAMQQCGSRAFIQITPSFGRQGSGRLSGETPGAPSAIPSDRPQDWEERIMPLGYETRAQQSGPTTIPKVLTIDEIAYMERTYPDAVAAARICGFDAVEFHSPHGYLIHQFLSPRSNQRNDLYGGSLENRFRFLRNLLIASRRRVGPDYPLGIRLSGDEHMPGAIHEDELIQIAKWCQELGASYIHLSDGSYEARKWFFPQSPDCMIAHARNFKKELKIPLLCPSIHDPFLAEELLANGVCDMITMGRQLVADPRAPRKWQEGRVDDVNRCLRCNVCLSRFNRGLAIRCVTNPDIGREKYAPKYYGPVPVTNALRPVPEAKQPPCEATCPAGIDVMAYVLMTARGQFDEAYRRLKVELPFPGVIGRVCPHPCEAECNRGKLDEPVAINAIKRYVADYVMKNGMREYIKKHARPDKALPVTKKEKVAVVGAGPAGLTAAYFLRKKGYAVTVFEAEPAAGGIMAWGIPEYRLPKKIVEYEIEGIKNIGVEIKLNSPVNSISSLQEKGYQAVFLATGAPGSLELGVEGENLNGVVPALPLLKDVSMGKKVTVGKKVVVIGGGSVAMDVAATVVRLGAGDVTAVTLECDEAEMPAYEDEIALTREESVKLVNSWGVKKIIGSGGKVSGIELKRCVSVFDKTGKFCPVYDEGQTRSIDADMVITAIGQCADGAAVTAGSKVKVTKRGTIEADEWSKATNVAGVFTGGDVARGAGLLIEAIADGKKAAAAIDAFLHGEAPPTAPDKQVLADIEEPAFQFHLRETRKEERCPTASIPVSKRKGNFNEVNTGFADKETCIKEARRCVTCRCSSMRY